MRRTGLSNPDGAFVNLVADLTISATGIDGMSVVGAAAGGISFGNSDTHDSVSFLIGGLSVYCVLYPRWTTATTRGLIACENER